MVAMQNTNLMVIVMINLQISCSSVAAGEISIATIAKVHFLLTICKSLFI